MLTPDDFASIYRILVAVELANMQDEKWAQRLLRHTVLSGADVRHLIEQLKVTYAKSRKPRAKG